MSRVLTINPGSTSTKVVIFHGIEAVFSSEQSHPKDELSHCPRIIDQLRLRREALHQAIEEAGEAAIGLDAIVGRGGLLAPMPGGTYSISPAMLDDLQNATHGEHACNLGAILAHDLGQAQNIPAFIVDPVVTDELMDEARLTGHPLIKRRSLFHALSQRGAARTAAKRVGVDYEKGNFIVIHLGGGTSIGAHCQGLVVDVVNALDGEGPLTPERTGALPILDVLQLLESGARDTETLRREIVREGGLYALLGSNDFRVVEERIRNNDHKAKAVIQAMAYAVAKCAAGLLPAFAAQGGPEALDAIVLTGGLARSPLMIQELRTRLEWMGHMEIVLGLEEMLVMAQGADRVLQGKEAAKTYDPEPTP